MTKVDMWSPQYAAMVARGGGWHAAYRNSSSIE
jgi:hypothetical protein